MKFARLDDGCASASGRAVLLLLHDEFHTKAGVREHVDQPVDAFIKLGKAGTIRAISGAQSWMSEKLTMLPER